MEAIYEVGEIVYSLAALYNDGGIPDVAPDALLAPAGGRGVVVQIGYAESDDTLALYLVRFEDESGELGPPVGVYPDELTQQEGDLLVA